MGRAIRFVQVGAAAGLVAGPVVGLSEALYVLAAGNPSEYGALAWGALLYGAGGMVVGAVFGTFLAVVGLLGRGMGEPMAGTLSFAVVGCGLGFTISWHRQGAGLAAGADPSPMALAGTAGAFLALALVALWLGPILLTRTPFKIVLRLRGTVALFLAQVVLASVFSLSPPRGVRTDGVLAPDKAPSDELLEEPDVVVLAVDALRADALGVAGVTPHLDALAARSVRFEQAIAASSASLPAMASLLSSRRPTGHACVDADHPYTAETATLAQVLSWHGVVTGFLPNGVEVTPASELQRGFDWAPYRPPVHPLGATESARHLVLVDVATRIWRLATARPPHPDESFRPAEEMFELARLFIEANEAARYLLVVHLLEPQGFGAAEVPARRPEGAYAADVGRLDAAVGAFLGWLDARPRSDRTVVVLVGTHGEALGERGGWGHGDTLYDEQIRVPLLVRLPGGTHAGRVVPWQVRAVDLAPTLVALQGALPDPGWEGEDLLGPAFQARYGEDAGEAPATEPRERVAVAEILQPAGLLRAVRIPAWKILSRPDCGGCASSPVEVYDLAADPGERTNVVGSLPGDKVRLAGLLDPTAGLPSNDVPEPDDAGGE